MKKFSLSLFLTFVVLLSPGNLALAEDGSSSIESHRNEIKANMEARRKEVKERTASRSAERQERLDAQKEKICERRKSNIIHRSENITKRVEKHFMRFGELVTKVDTFYTTKLVPKGVLVPDYAALKADIDTQKIEVQTALTDMKATVAAFDCAGQNPKGQLEDFKTQTKIVHSAMKDYRTAIKNFVQAIKTAVKEKKAATASAEPELD